LTASLTLWFKGAGVDVGANVLALLREHPGVSDEELVTVALAAAGAS
jgi:hypothetical protein